MGVKEFPLIAGSTQIVKDFAPFGYANNQLCIQAMLDGKIRAFFVPGCNIVVSEGNSRKTADALRKLDFLVVVDFFMTPTAELADLVLPAAHFLETETPLRACQRMGAEYQNYILAPRRVIEPIEECWDDRKIVIELAKRMGVDVPWQSTEEHNDWQLEEFGVRYADIQSEPNQMISWCMTFNKYCREGFRFKTPSGKIELYSNILKNHGYDPLPSYVEPTQIPVSTSELSKEYPLILTNHRSVIYVHSEGRQLPSVRKRFPDPLIEINPRTALELEISDGDEVYIESPGVKDRICMKARLSPGIHPAVVSCPSHWWFPEKPALEHGCFDSNINTIISTDPPYDPITGTYAMRGLLCRIGKSR